MDRTRSRLITTINYKTMETTIKNNQRVFLITGDMNQSLICNIEDLERCYNEFADRDNIKIQHKWNNRFVRCSKKSIVDLLKALNLSYSFLK